MRNNEIHRLFKAFHIFSLGNQWKSLETAGVSVVFGAPAVDLDSDGRVRLRPQRVEDGRTAGLGAAAEEHGRQLGR